MAPTVSPGTRDDDAQRTAGDRPWARPEYWVPALYAAVAAAWIALSDLLLAMIARSSEQIAAASIVKGIGFVAVTAGLLHGALRRALAREREASERLSSSEALLRAITDAIPDPVFLKDRESRWLFANPATLAVLGKGQDAVLGKTDAEIYADPAIGSALMENDRRIMEAGATASVEETIETPSGRRLYLSSKAPYRDREGRVVGIIGNARDITERQKAEEALRGQLALKEQLARIAESVPGLICSFRMRPDGSACMPFTTPALDDIYGLAPDAVARDVGPWAANVHVDDLERVMAGVTEAGKTFARWHDEYRYHHPTKGLRWIEGWFVPVREPDGSILWYGYVTDVTDRRRLQEQFQSAQRLESVGRLAGGIAHDFNNLLTVILGCTSALERDVAMGARAGVEEIHELRTAAERAADLTRQLLAFARRQVIAPVALDLNEVVRGSERLLRRLLGEDIELLVRPQAGLWRVKADAGQLEQVILNLAVNARDAMPDGGTLVIETSNAAATDLPPTQRSASDPGPVVCLVVRDTGTGMPPAVREHLFEPFFTTKEVGTGTGLGLATVHGIVNQLGGRIHVESGTGLGTTFTLLFPQTLEAPARVRDPAPRRIAGGRASGTVLVVEDDPMVRGVTVRSLRAEGYRVLVAANGGEALALQAEELATLDLLVTDMVMPGLDGRQVAEAMRRRRPGLRVLFVSGYSADVVAERGLLEPGIGLLEKPFTPEALAARVRAILDGR